MSFYINENVLTYVKLVKNLLKGTDCSLFTYHSSRALPKAILSKTKTSWTNNVAPTLQKRWQENIRIGLGDMSWKLSIQTFTYDSADYPYNETKNKQYLYLLLVLH